MEAKKRFKLYKSGKLWCCAAVAFGVMAFGTVNGQADDATPATT
ncbi:MAG TPA: KxYKxGKxW signal peptide domain-containing protein, partial [Limosilactobacillus oris]|nr:KxYKxGKxW signal peptide domain-containing protein [Limosilactobacillus oris]